MALLGLAAGMTEGVSRYVSLYKIHTFPSVSFHRCRCVSVKCVERVLSVLEARRPCSVCGSPRLPTPRALPVRGALWPLAVGVEKDLGGNDV